MNSEEIAGRIFGALTPDEEARELFLALLRELAKGEPVLQATIEAALGWPADKVQDVMDRVPSLEFDDNGHVVGAGLTLRETPHAFEVGEKRLYTWCALDALMFPAMIGKTARVSSRCAVTGEPIRLTVTPEGIREVEPTGAVVSLVLPDTSPNLRQSFCVQVVFFASEVAARPWLDDHPGSTVVSLKEAYRLGRELAVRMTTDGHFGQCC